MKNFDAYLQRAQLPKWKDSYIDYGSLKETLKQFGKRRRQLQRGDLDWSTVLESHNNNDTNNTSNDETENNAAFGYTLQDTSADSNSEGVFRSSDTKEDRLSKLEHDEFKTNLQAQLDKATRWFHASWVELQSTSFEKEEREEEGGILDLYGFAVVNICVLRQLILKYNAYVRMHDGTMFVSEWEILQHPQSPLPSLLSTSLMVSELEQVGEDASVDYSIKTVVPSLLALEPLQDRMMTMPSYWMMSDSPEAVASRKTNKQLLSDFRSRADELESLLDQTSWKQQTRQSPNKTERLLLTIRSFYMIGAGNLGISMEPKFLYAQVRGFKKEMKALAVWRERPLAVERGDEEVFVTGEMDPANVWPLFLNLVSCFLFMMNNYIIEPSSAYYANALGSSDALSGVMMGMAPWFALTSAVGYSIWTNKSYKQPILFAGTLMVIGNTLYGAAYSYQSMTMCLVGRAISGFGAPRIINRRYVADATPFSLRTISSAAFALTTALGAASGPGFAILLDLVPEFEFYLPILGVQTFNAMTGPGFVMAVLWFVFTIAIVISFGEPNRSGLDELKQREEAKKKQASEAALMDMDAAGLQAFDEDDDSVGSLSVGSFDKRRRKEGFQDEDGGEDEDEEIVSKHSPMYCIRNMTRATALCMGLIFMKRIALEVGTNLTFVSKNYFVFTVPLVDSLSRCFPVFPIFFLVIPAEYRWIDVRYYEKPIFVVDPKRWNTPSGERFDRDSCFHICRMALTVS